MYGDGHRAFLQIVINNGIVDHTEAVNLISTMFGPQQDFRQVISEVNAKLKPLNMLIKNSICEVTGKKYWIHGSIVYDGSEGFTSIYSPAEIEYLREIFHEILGSENVYIPSIQCLNLSSTLQHKLSRPQAQELLSSIISQKWLHLQDGNFYIGPRSIGELLPYFKTMYEGDFEKCLLCRQVIFYGENCNSCHRRIHIYCLAKYVSTVNTMNCPNCNHVLTPNNLPDVGEFDLSNEASDMEDELIPTQTSVTSRQSQRKRKR